MPETKEAEETQQPPTRPQQYVTVKVMYQAVVFVSLAMSICSTVVYDRYFSTKVAMYDLPELLRKLEVAEASKQITPEQSRQILLRTKAMVESMPSNYIVFAGGTILGTPARVKEIQLPTSR